MNTLDNFLIRFFWPKEMRQLVDQYRSEGCLNEEAVRNVNRRITKQFILSLLIFVGCAWLYSAFMDGLAEVIFISGTGLLCLHGAILEPKRFLNAYVLPLNLGKKVQGRLLKVWKHYIGSAHVGWFVTYQILNTEEYTEKKFNLRSKSDYDESYSPDNELPIYLLKNEKFSSVPGFNVLIEKYMLKKEGAL